MKKIFSIIFLYGVASVFISCNKLVQVESPYTQIQSGNVYNDKATASSVLITLYGRLSQQSGGFFSSNSNNPGLAIALGTSADELDVFTSVSSGNLLSLYTNTLTPTNNSHVSGLWTGWYQSIYYCNSVIEGLSTSTLDAVTKNQLLGEAKFIRALFLFYLTNTFGDVPLVLTTYVPTNLTISRSAVQEVYKQIITDLAESAELLSPNFLDGNLEKGTIERVRPSKWAALALLARVYLYNGDALKAEQTATILIGQNTLFSLTNPASSFLRAGLGNKDAIFQLQPVLSGWNTEDARLLVINAAVGNNKPVRLSQSLLNSFEPGDLRRTNWVGDTIIGGTPIAYVHKYKLATLNTPVSEYHMLLRLSEQYLIRAEARALQNNLAGAIADINSIRDRSRATPTIAVPNPLPALPNSLSQAQVFDRIAQERRIELFAELGHRWYDLKRSNKIDQIMTPAAIVKGSTWQSYRQLFPIPQSEMDLNLNIIQNPGYN